MPAIIQVISVVLSGGGFAATLLRVLTGSRTADRRMQRAAIEEVRRSLELELSNENIDDVARGRLKALLQALTKIEKDPKTARSLIREERSDRHFEREAAKLVSTAYVDNVTDAFTSRGQTVS